ncbi:phage tail sheath subtilisin-like domain-containing protein [Natrialbaceae archaeon GCM10025810]|uniref:phage tail sheath subtilisin-like domain-containing protein n=1 Tax=Halovalidus salilacus TaxID=3075124 RepID=UPI00361B7848
MVTIGNTRLPGVQLTVQSSRSVGVNVGSPGEAGLIGQADFAEGTAEPNEVHRITNAPTAAALFGRDSPLAINVADALSEGAFPVYAIAPDEIDASDDVMGSTGTLSEAPLSEDPDDITFEVGGTTLTTTVVLEEPESLSPSENEVLVNPVDGTYHLDASGSVEGTASYIALDYEGAIDALVDEEGDILDFIGILPESEEVASYLHDVVKDMESKGDFAIAIAGATSHLEDVFSYENPFDSSRIQLQYPMRNADGESMIGSYVGLRAGLGMNASPMKKRLSGQDRLYHSLSREEMEALVEERVNPIKSERAGALVMDDVTTVSPENPDEYEFQQGISRLVTDYVAVITNENADMFIGELHTQAARNALRGNIKSELKDLLSLSAIVGYTVEVEPIDAMEARVNVGIETIKPLRNIRATVTAGQVE